MKIQLTIKTSYLPNWGSYEGVRELLQNGRDAEIEHGAPLMVDWYNDTLRIANEGTTVPLKALLLGHTTKLGNSDMIGKFGEGLKLGILALVRAGHDVKVRNGSEVWIPFIERSDTFDEDVLTFRIEGGRDPKNRFRVEIGGITREAWKKMKENFLFLVETKTEEKIDSYVGTLLLGAKDKGRVYVKGIFVQSDPELSFGYNLKDAELDRDRKMIESWNLRYHTKNVFMAAMASSDSLMVKFDEMLQDPTTEIETVDIYSTIPEKASQYVAAKFMERHGADAVPVQNLLESKDIEHLGKRGVIVSKQHGAVLARTLGDAQTVKTNLGKEELTRYGWGDLTDGEKANLSDAVALINAVEALGIATIEVVDFRDPGLNGQYKDGRILIARKLLVDADETLSTLVHEAAHRLGHDDGAKGHVARIEDLWKGIVRNLRAGR